jgi:hypothetical protein
MNTIVGMFTASTNAIVLGKSRQEQIVYVEIEPEFEILAKVTTTKYLVRELGCSNPACLEDLSTFEGHRFFATEADLNTFRDVEKARYERVCNEQRAAIAAEIEAGETDAGKLLAKYRWNKPKNVKDVQAHIDRVQAQKVEQPA